MKKIFSISLIAVLLAGCTGNNQNIPDYEVIKSNLRAPAFPLITIDPYTSAWSMSDNLYDEPVKHWTGKEFPLLGAIKVDDKFYRFMGTENIPMDVIAPTSERGTWKGKYIFSEPAKDWMEASFDDSKWLEGEGAFGTRNEPTAQTIWNMRTVDPKVHVSRSNSERTDDVLRPRDPRYAKAIETPYIWVRRVVNIDSNFEGRKVFLEYSHDDDAIIYINGIKVVDTGHTNGKNILLRLEGNVLASLKKGENIIAGYCYNRTGNGLLDFGIVMEKENMAFFETTARQTSVDVQATQTHYNFTCGDIDLKLTFTAPLFMEDIDLTSRPVNYITYEVKSKDGKEHDIEFYFEATPEWALDNKIQESMSEGFENNGLLYVKTGSIAQEILGKRGDDLRIDWGYFYMAAENKNTFIGVGSPEVLRSAFASSETEKLSITKTEKQKDNIAIIRKLGKTSENTGKIMIGYDDIYSIQYFEENLRPYWNRKGDKDIFSQFQLANNEYKNLIKRCYEFDKEMMNTAIQAGGKKYAELCALAYRQAITAHKIVEAPNGDLLFLSKENNSNGSIGTVDVTYPSAPLFLYYNPELAKGLLNHIFYYSESGKWTKPFPAHDVGTYPLANGQTYGGDMPVEESGNMIILTGVITAMEGNAKYAEKHWDVLTIWTDYLVEYGLDPENQLCTDDFAGHFAHNINLSVKAIMGVASYAYMADMLGKKDVSEKYYAEAKKMAAWWMENADDGDHYRLTFDREGTWSQKYNLVWNKLMKYDVFPADVAKKEIKYYLTKQNEFGLPLDNRETYTKTDWIIWTATLADDKATFEKFVDPVHKFMNETVTRVPMSDWIWTDKPYYRGFKARSVVGGYYIKMLESKLSEKVK